MESGFAGNVVEVSIGMSRMEAFFPGVTSVVLAMASSLGANKARLNALDLHASGGYTTLHARNARINSISV